MKLWQSLPMIIMVLAMGWVAEAVVPAKKTLSPKTGLVSQRTHRKLKRAHSLIEAKSYKDAINLLKNLAGQVKARPHELAQVLQTLGYAAASDSHYDEALEHFTEAVSLNALPVKVTLSMMYTVAQLQAQKEQYGLAMEQLTNWADYQETINPDQLAFWAMVAANTGEKAIALSKIEAAIEQAKKPKEAWMQLAVALLAEAKSYAAAATMLEKLVVLNPSKEVYWSQMAGMQMADNREIEALTTMDLAVKQGHLNSEQSHLVVAQLYSLQGVPHKAATFLEESIKTKVLKPSVKVHEQIAQAYRAAHEVGKAIHHFQTAAAFTGAVPGRIYQALGQLLISQEKYAEAAKFLSKATRAKDLSIGAKGRAQIALGIAQYRSKQAKTALRTLVAAQKNIKVASQATAWINHINAHN